MKKEIVKTIIGKKFIVYIEKVYEAEIDKEGRLICEPESEEIKEIRCLDNKKRYREKDFKEIQW